MPVLRPFFDWAGSSCGSLLRGYVQAQLLQSCSTLCDATDCSPQAPQSMGFSRQDYQNRLPCPPPGDLTEPQDQTRDSCISCITGTSLPTEPPGMPVKSLKCAHCTQVSFFFLSENDTLTIIYIAPIKTGKSTAWLVWLQCLHTSIYLVHRNQD